MLAYRWKGFRATLGVTQQQMADKLGVHLRTYRRWENMEIIPKKEVQCRITNLLLEIWAP